MHENFPKYACPRALDSTWDAEKENRTKTEYNEYMQNVNKPLDESYLKAILVHFRALVRALVVGLPSNPNHEELYKSLLAITFTRDR